MSKEKESPNPIDAGTSFRNDAAVAVAIEEEAKAGPDISTYTHMFKAPFDYQGTVIKKLTFEWGKLTGVDHLEIENELLMRGKTLLTPEFACDFLWRMAVRACTLVDEKGVRVLRADASRFMPIRDFQVICKKARGFLLRAGS